MTWLADFFNDIAKHVQVTAFYESYEKLCQDKWQCENCNMIDAIWQIQC